jgi:hypothetical protein
MEIAPPIAEKWTDCVRFAIQKAGSVPDFDFLRNVAEINKRRSPSANPGKGCWFARLLAAMAARRCDEKICGMAIFCASWRTPASCLGRGTGTRHSAFRRAWRLTCS